MVGRFFFSSEFNKNRNTLRANKPDVVQGFNFNIKLKPVNELWFYECTTRKEDLFANKAPLNFNQMYCIDNDRFYDIIHSTETSNCIVWTVRERTGDCVVWDYIGDKEVTLKRCSHNIISEGFDISKVGLYDMALLNAESVVPFNKVKPPIIMYCYWLLGNNVPSWFKSIVVKDHASGNDNDRVTALQSTCLVVFGMYDPQTKSIKKGFRVNGYTTVVDSAELEGFFTAQKLQIVNTTVALWYDYSGDFENGVTLYNTQGVLEFTRLYEATSLYRVGNVVGTYLETSFDVNQLISFVTTDPHATLSLNVFGQVCTVSQEPNSNLKNPIIYIIQHILPQCTSFNVFLEKASNNSIDNETITKNVLSFEITGGVIRDITAYDQYNLDNPSAYALSVKMPMQSQDFQYRQTLNDSLFNGAMSVGSGGMQMAMGNYVGGGMQIATAGLTTAYNINKAKETSNFNKQQILDKFRYEMENLKAQKGSVTPVTNMFMLLLCGSQPVSFFSVNYVNATVLKVLHKFYLSFGFNFNIRGKLPTSTTIPRLYMETNNLLYDINIVDGLTSNDARIVDICEQLDRGVILIYDN